MQRYAMTVAYEGTFFSGWQVQKGRMSVAQCMQDRFAKIFGRPVSLLGASRTDAGVHALGQVVTFATDLEVTAQELKQAWNNLLPPTIVIRSLQKVPADFNPHHGIEYKEYWYHLFPQRPLPFVQRYGWFYRYPIDYEKLRDCLDVLVGTHDFCSFYTHDGVERDTVRTVDAIDLGYEEQLSAYRIRVKGARFLRYMIRRMVGAAVDVASRKDVSIERLQQVLAQRDPRHTLPNAPAQGLVLHSITYKSGALYEKTV